MGASLSVAVLSVLPVAAQTAAHSPIQSVFIMPANPAQGHDPFFPDSTRPYSTSVSAHSPTLAATLTITGISRDSNNNYFAIIGNHTYGAGDEGDVKTAQGSIHIRCVEIKPNSVVVEVDGQFHELPFSDNP